MDGSIRVSYAVLLPTKGAARENAAGRVLHELETLFPLGGICFSTPGGRPVIWGWWKPRGSAEAEVVRDLHLWVEVHSRVDALGKLLAETRKSDVKKITSTFRVHYVGEAAEKVIYVMSQELDAYELPGTTQ